MDVVGLVCCAKSGFEPSRVLLEIENDSRCLDSSRLQFLLRFEKGDQFEILEEIAEEKSENKEKFLPSSSSSRSWLGVRAIRNDAVGFIPANYVTIEQQQDRIDATVKSSQAIYVLALEELKQRPEFQQSADKNLLNIMIPEPDYSDCEGEEDTSAITMMSPHTNRAQHHSTDNGHSADDHIIEPRKLTNPYADSREKQNLHRELLFNQKIGKNVLGQKSELKKAMDKFQEDQKKKELENEKLNKRTSLERKLEEQANKIKMLEGQVLQEKSEDPNSLSSLGASQSEFHRVHAKVRAKVDTQ